MHRSLPSLSYPLAKGRKLQTLRISSSHDMEEPGGQSDSDTVALYPHPPQCHCTGLQWGRGAGGTGTLLLRPLDVWIYVMEQMVSLILTDLYRCPVCGVGKCTRSPEFHPGPSFQDKQRDPGRAAVCLSLSLSIYKRINNTKPANSDHQSQDELKHVAVHL